MFDEGVLGTFRDAKGFEGGGVSVVCFVYDDCVVLGEVSGDVDIIMSVGEVAP